MTTVLNWTPHTHLDIVLVGEGEPHCARCKAPLRPGQSVVILYVVDAEERRPSLREGICLACCEHDKELAPLPAHAGAQAVLRAGLRRHADPWWKRINCLEPIGSA